MPEKIILDCDPGHDDAIAMLIAAGNPNIELLGITTVAGNQTLPKVTRNALSVCTAAGISVPVAAGAAGPLVQQQVIAGDVHGVSGLDGPHLPEPTVELDPRHAAQFIVETVMAQPAKTVHLVPVGPLTNVALAMRLEPQIVDRVKSVMLMGGAYTRGNTTPTSEFNVFADPEAAAAVFAADWDVTMVGLDLTHQALAKQELQDRVRAIGGELSTMVLDIWEFITSTYWEMYEFPHPPVHDAVCVAAIADPSIIHCERAFVAVELTGQWTRGMTVANFAEGVAGMHHAWSGLAEHAPNTNVAITLDWDKFADIIIDAVATLSRRAGVRSSETGHAGPNDRSL